MAFYNCTSLSGNLNIPFSVEFIGTGAFENTHFDCVISRNPVPIECGNAFSSDQKIILPSIYYSNECCGIKLNDKPDKPVVVPTPAPVEQIIEQIELDGSDTNAQIVNKIEELRDKYKDSEKVLLIDGESIDYTSTLKDDEFIMMKNDDPDTNAQINYKEGKLNVIFIPENKQYIKVESIDDFNFTCKGNGNLKFILNEDKQLNLTNPIEINGSTKFIKESSYNNVFNIHSITFKNNVVFTTDASNYNDLILQKVKVDPYSKVKIMKGGINESLTIEQTGFLDFQQSIHLNDGAEVNLNVYDFNRIDPFFGGYVPTIRGKLKLNKINDDSNPISNKNYVIAFGYFSGSCQSWIDKIYFDNSGFNKIEYNTITMLKKIISDIFLMTMKV